MSSKLEGEDEEECVYLPEDYPVGKFFFIHNYLFPFLLLYEIHFVIIVGVILFVQLYDTELTLWPSKMRKVFKWCAPALCIPLIFFIWLYVVFFRYHYAGISTSVVIYLLKEIELQSLRDSSIDWRQTAYLANELSEELDDPLPKMFYSGDHCMKYFEKYIAGAVRDGSYYMGGGIFYPNFGGKKSHRDLLDRSVQCYRNVAKNFH